jgi:hypothetical protein
MTGATVTATKYLGFLYRTRYNSRLVTFEQRWRHRPTRIYHKINNLSNCQKENRRKENRDDGKDDGKKRDTKNDDDEEEDDEEEDEEEEDDEDEDDDDADSDDDGDNDIQYFPIAITGNNIMSRRVRSGPNVADFIGFSWLNLPAIYVTMVFNGSSQRHANMLSR